MALTDLGIIYICRNFGDNNFCCVKTGLTWRYTVDGETITENGGTAQVVSRLASGLVDNVTMINPSRGTFTKNDLDTANTQTVTLEDCQIIAQHDEPQATPPGQQWCHYETPPPPPPPGATPNLILIGAVVAAVCVVGIVFMVGKR